MKIILRNTDMVFEAKKKKVVITPTQSATGKGLAYSSSSNVVIFATSSLSDSFFYNLDALGIKEGDKLSIYSVFVKSNIAGAMFFSKDVNNTSDVSDFSSSNVGEKIVGTEISGTAYSKIDEDVIVPQGAKTLVVSYRNGVEEYVAKVEK